MTAYFDLADSIIGLVLLAGIPAYFVLQVWVAVRLPRTWRLLALLPLVLVVGLFVLAVQAVAGHAALWLVPLLLFAPIADLYLLAVLAVRRRLAHAAG